LAARSNGPGGDTDDARAGPLGVASAAVSVIAAPPTLMVDGRLVPAGEVARVAVDDGLVRGDGVFEGMRLYDRRPRTPALHLDRLERSADRVGLHVDRERLEAELAEFCRATADPDCAVRLIVTRGGQRVWREERLPADLADGMRLLPVPHRLSPLLVGAKTLSYAANMEAGRRARAAGCHDALLVGADDGHVLEGPTWSLGWLEGDVLVFPPLELGILDSITRRLASQALPTRERAATVAELARADGALALSTVMEARPVAEIRGVASFDPASAGVLAAAAAIRRAIAARVA
jgi:branched-subunit amino acid aminotransferase/4-amino-4-deoxychorismate lyase